MLRRDDDLVQITLHQLGYNISETDTNVSFQFNPIKMGAQFTPFETVSSVRNIRNGLKCSTFQ